MQTETSCAISEANITLAARSVYIFRAYVTPYLVVYGGIGNVLVIIAFCLMQQKVASRFNIYVIAMTAAQTGEIVLNAFLDDFLGRGVYWLSDCNSVVKIDITSNGSCKFLSYIAEVSAFCSTCILALFSVDRVLTIYKPISFRGNRYRKHAYIGIASVCVLACILYGPMIAQFEISTIETDGGRSYPACGFKDLRSSSAKYILFMTAFGSVLLPDSIILISNILIFLKFRKIFRERSQMSGTNVSTSDNEFRRITGHLSIISTYIVLALPLAITVLIIIHSETNDYDVRFPEYAKSLTHLSRLFLSIKSLSYGLEFVILFACMPKFRKELKRLLSCKGRELWTVSGCKAIRRK